MSHLINRNEISIRKNKHIKSSVTRVVISLVLYTLTVPVFAVDKYWSYTDCGSSWWDYPCWSTTFGGALDSSRQPLDGDDVYLYNTSASDYQIAYYNTLYPAAVLNSLTINASNSGSMTLVYSSNHNLSTLTETIGDTGSGILTQTSGTHSVSNDLILGNSATGNGIFSLSNTAVLSAGNIIVGNEGTGLLTINNTATVTGNGSIGQKVNSTGTINVSGTGSILNGTLTVGHAGTGVLNIDDGGSVSGVSTIGYEAGSSGTVTVSGAGSNLSAGIIGRSGTGLLDINIGGTASGYSGYLGYNSTGHGTVNVSGPGSTLTTSNHFIIGGNADGLLSGDTVSAGTGFLNITDGGSFIIDGSGINPHSGIGMNINSAGTVTVSGASSSWNNNTSLTIGSHGTGVLNVENGATVTSVSSSLGRHDTGHGTVLVTGAGSSWNSGALSISGTTTALSYSLLDTYTDGTGILHIMDGASVTSASAEMGLNTNTVTNATVDDANWTINGELEVGLRSTANLSILNGGNVTSVDSYIGGGEHRVQTELFHFETFQFYGDGTVTVDGIGSSWINNGTLTSYAGHLSILNGGSVFSERAELLDNDNYLDNGTVTIDGIGSTWTNTGLLINNNSLLTISNGGSLINGGLISSGFNINSGGSLFTGVNASVGASQVTIDGSGSIWNHDSFSGSNIDHLILSGGAIVNHTNNSIGSDSVTVDGIGTTLNSSIGISEGGVIAVSNGGTVNSQGIGSNGEWNLISITSGSSVNSVDGVAIKSVFIEDIDSTLTTGGINSKTLTIRNGGSVTSGNTIVSTDLDMSGTAVAGEDARLDITGSLTVGGLSSIGEYAHVTVSDTLSINGLHIDGGSIVTGQLAGNLADSILDAGTLTISTPGPTIDIGGTTFGNTVGGSFSMVLPQDTLIEIGETLTLKNNSSLTANLLNNDGAVTGYGAVNASINGTVNSTLTASGGSLVLGNADSFNGFRTMGSIDVGANDVTLNSMQFARLGYQTELDGGTLNAENGVFLDGANAIVGSGNVNASIAAQTGSTIFASGDLALGDADKFDGFHSQGNLRTNQHTVTINDRNEAVLGSLTTLGNTIGAGTLQSSNGLLLQQGNSLVGYGTVNGAFINQGHVEETGALPTDQLEFTGDVTGAGDYAGDIVFSGTFSPGNSPALVPFEEISFTTDSILSMEIGGLTAGSKYDLLQGITGSSATLAGTLNIDLYDLGGDLFNPALGDSFDILTADIVIGEFDLLTMAILGNGLDWQLDYLLDEIGTMDIVRLSVVSDSAVPLPPAGWLFISGLIGLIIGARRKTYN